MQATAQARLPGIDHGVQALFEAGRQQGHFLAQVAHQAATLEFILGHAAFGVFDEGGYALQRRQVFVEEMPIEASCEIVGVVVQHGMPEGLLAFEIIVERAFGHADLGQQQIDAGTHEALFGQQRGTAANQRIAGVGIGAGAFRRTPAAFRQVGHGMNIDRSFINAS
ncbi:hypothetical protein D3C86_1575960 [compost metagenome]